MLAGSTSAADCGSGSSCPENRSLRDPLIGDSHVEVQPLQPFHEVASDGVTCAFVPVRRPEVAIGPAVAKQHIHDCQDRVGDGERRLVAADPACQVPVLRAQIRVPRSPRCLRGLGQRGPQPLVPMSGPPALPLAGTLVIAGQIYVDKMIGTSAPAKPAARRFSSRRPAAAATPVAETASDATPARKRRPMTAKRRRRCPSG